MPHFTSKAEIELLIGKRGVNLRLDDLSSTSSAVEQALTWADEKIKWYTHFYYRTEALLGNAWIKSIATVLAADYLSQRRGNKNLFGNYVHEIIDQLDQIKRGEAIPDAIPFFTETPSVRNQKVVATGGPNNLKIEPTTSTGGGYPDEDFGPPWAQSTYPYGY